MACKYKFEMRDQRIERMKRDNPNRAIQLCTSVVDGLWDNKQESILEKIPERFRGADMADLGYLADDIANGLNQIFDPPSKKNDNIGMIFCGPAGSGKTYAAYAVMKWIAERNPEMIAYMASYPQAIQALRNEFVNNTYDEIGSVWDKLNNDSGMYDGLIFLDDVSTQKQTDFEIDKLTAFLDKRMNEYMPFILTTNISMKDFRESFGERLASRFLGYCVIVEFEKLDKRLEN
jgi:DNA replication protein DnaC